MLRFKHYSSLLLVFLVAFNTNGIAQEFEPGVSYRDSTGFIEFIGGNVPVIISAPHGGYLEPDSIPDCPGCSTLRDAYTQEIGRGLSESYFEKTGCYPYVIINLLHRRKLDANRDIDDATGGLPNLESAWSNYHGFIDTAKTQITQQYGRGLFIDLHGHAHDIQRIELGYLLSKPELQMTDIELNSTEVINDSSIRGLVSDNIQSLTHAELLRGDLSFGTLMDDNGFPGVPSQSDLFPEDDEPYFTGGYNTSTHGSKNGGTIDAIQLEFNQAIRFDDEIREELIDSLASTLVKFINAHYIADFSTHQCSTLSSNSESTLPLDISVYPNPVSDRVYIQSSELEMTSVSVINSMGQRIATESLSTTNHCIETQEWNAGIYLLEIRSNETTTLKKIVVEK